MTMPMRMTFGIRRPSGCATSVPTIATGIDRRAGLQREPRDAGLAAVQPPVGAARALGVDAEQVAVAQAAQAGAQRGLARLAAPAVDGDGADAAHEARGEPALDARAR